MNVKGLLIAILALLVAGAAWFFVSPLFIDEVVDEAPIVATAVPTRAEVDAMPPPQREKLMSRLMTAATAAPDHEMDEPMAMAMAETPLVLATGMFSDADAVHRGSGRADVYRLNDGSHIIRFEDFKVTNGPALVVLLAEAAEPQNAGDVKRGYVKLGELKGNKGNQNYIVPAGVDAEQHGSVVIWCELFDVLFSAAPLSAI